MAAYKLKKADLNKTSINGVPVSKVISANPTVQWKAGAVVSVPATNEDQNTTVNKATQPLVAFNPQGMQGVSGVSNTGQGIPNVVANKFQGNAAPSMQYSNLPANPADRLAAEYPSIPRPETSVPLTPYGYGFAGMHLGETPATTTPSTILTPASSTRYAGVRQPVSQIMSPADRLAMEYQQPSGSAFPASIDPRRVDMTVPASRLEAEYILPEIEQLFTDPYNGMYATWQSGADWVDFNDFQREIFYTYAPQEWIDLYEQMLAGNVQENNLNGIGDGYYSSGGGSGGGGGGGGGGYSSNSGAFYGLINWRI